MVDLLEGEALAHLVTLRPDGRPHVTPVWVDHEGGDILVDVRSDRLKAANMQARPDVALSILDPRNPYRYLSITGVVTGWSEDGWRDHMDRLAQRYMKQDNYPWASPEERRLIFRIRPTRVFFERG